MHLPPDIIHRARPPARHNIPCASSCATYSTRARGPRAAAALAAAIVAAIASCVSTPPPRSGSCAGSCAGEAVERGGEALLAARPAAGEAGRCPRTTPLPPAAAAARRCRIPKGRAVGGCSARAPSLGLRAAAASAAAEREEGCSERAGSERLPLEEAGLMPREAGEAAPPPHEKPAVAVAAVGEAETGGGAPDASREGVPGRLAALTAVELEPGLPSCEQELPSCEQDLPSAAAAAARSRAARAAWRCLTPRLLMNGSVIN
mmetsp:Transcript_30625/g.95788  ORF Transcript_30625/g.95788 Transcript_30625/m.95788 type:complete len:262 (+) Transcript_30625:101-886(+)